MISPSFFTSVINGYLAEPYSSLLNGMLFGIQSKMQQELYLELKTVGLLHMIVLSGTNITILSSMISALTKQFSKKLSILITALTIILFVLFVRPQAPIVRAACMSILTMVAIVIGRKRTPLYILFFTFVLQFIFFPQWVSKLSFQLSYAATLGIILFAKKEIIRPHSLHGKISQAIRQDLRISLSAQVFTAPLIFFHFKEISLIAPVSNLLVSFMVAPIMFIGLLTVIFGKISYVLGVVPSYLAYGMLKYMMIVIELLSRLPFAFIHV